MRDWLIHQSVVLQPNLKIQGEDLRNEELCWSFEEFTGFLFSKENCIMVGTCVQIYSFQYKKNISIFANAHFQDPHKLSVHQNMHQPLSQYFINSSFKIQVIFSLKLIN